MKEGAYRKAIAAVSHDSLPFSNEENRTWADKLHPRSRNPVEACSRGDPTQPASDDPTDEAEPGDDGYIHPLSGVRFAALKAPSPSGLRPEHLSELLGVSRRRVATAYYEPLAGSWTASKKEISQITYAGLTVLARFSLRKKQDTHLVC